MFFIIILHFYTIFEPAHEILVRNAFVKLCLNMNGLAPSWQEVLILSCTFIHTHLLRVHAVKALARLSASTAASRHFRLIDNIISIQNHMSWSFF